jgi:hypothetical protein
VKEACDLAGAPARHSAAASWLTSARSGLFPNLAHPTLASKHVRRGCHPTSVMLDSLPILVVPTEAFGLPKSPRKRVRQTTGMASQGASGSHPTLPVTESEDNHDILNTTAALGHLQISPQTMFNFEPPEGTVKWPLEPYGPRPPHLEFAKARKPARGKRQPVQANPSRPMKTRKPKTQAVTKPRKAEPSKGHGPLPEREEPLHLLNLPGELRDILYDILVLQDQPLHPQLRPVLKREGRRLVRVIRRHPLEPTLALVNKQLRHEVLSVFYGANRFILRISTESQLEVYSMTQAANITRFMTANTVFLRHLTLEVEARGRLGFTFSFIYTFKKAQDGKLSIKHSLAGMPYCTCLENQAVAATLATHDTSVGANLAGLAALLGKIRTAKLSEVAEVDKEEKRMYKMPTSACPVCHNPYLSFVRGG